MEGHRIMGGRIDYKTAVYCRFRPDGPEKRIALGPGLRSTVVAHLKNELLTIGHGESFASELSFDGSPPIVLVCQRIGQTAAIADWQDSGQSRLAASAVLSGLDDRDDQAAIETLRQVWKLPFSDRLFDDLGSRKRPVMGTFVIEKAGYDHPALEGGVGCLGIAFGDLLGQITVH
jgi:hypothetical protein